MDAETARWLIGLFFVVVLVPLVGWLHSRIGGVDTKINDVDKEFNAQITAVEQRLESFKKDIEMTVSGHRQDYYDRLLTIHQTLSALSSSGDGISRRLDDLIERYSRLEEKLDQELQGRARSWKEAQSK